MKNSSLSQDSRFDDFAFEYDSALEQGLSVSGENKDYFCRQRILWLNKCLEELDVQPKSLLDFGCGTGSAVPYFFDSLRINSFLGVDTSSKSLEIARRSYGSEAAMFELIGSSQSTESFEVAYSNGVFHHIPVRSRSTAVAFVHRALRPRGLFAFWENNPWNPGTRYVMSRISFDRDAITLCASEAQGLLRKEGFDVLRTDFLFIFPRFLKHLRWIEPRLSKVPLGAQYQILCRKP